MFSKAALDTLCAQLANRGLVVVAYVLRPHCVALVLSGGPVVEISYARLLERSDVVANLIASELEPFRQRVVGTYELPVEISERTLDWWRFLRWWRATRESRCFA